jgi:hypothetical protein
MCPVLARRNGRLGSGTVLHFTAMSGGSMTDTGPSCPNGSCALLSRHSVDFLQRRQSTNTVEKLDSRFCRGAFGGLKPSPH